MNELLAVPGLPYLALAFIALLAARDFVAYRRDFRLKYLLTPLVTIAIVCVVLLGMLKVRVTPFAAWVFLALVFSLVGDTLLMIEESDHFTHGLVFFLLAHLCYIGAFSTGYEFRSWQLILAGVQILAALAFGARIWKGLGAYRAPVVVYLSAITVMVFFACAAFAGGLTERAVLLSVGALLFALSDAALALNKFVVTIPHSTVLTWILYAPAQFLIALSCFFTY
jgi:uncharacterized membrane protein YhhN